MREVRLVLNAADLARVRLLSSADPIEETTLAAHRMSTLSKDPVYGQWARDTAASLGPAGARPLSVDRVLGQADIRCAASMVSSIGSAVGSRRTRVRSAAFSTSRTCNRRSSFYPQ